jgi:hypothetical protein
VLRRQALRPFANTADKKEPFPAEISAPFSQSLLGSLAIEDDELN